jgi:hypothetical protein
VLPIYYGVTAAARVAAFVAVAFLVWNAAGAAMLLIPHTPHNELLRTMQALDWFSKNGRDSPKANEAFDEFLRIGRQTTVVESTVLPVCAAVAVTVLSLWLSRLSNWDIGLVAAGFAVSRMLRTEIEYLELWDVCGVGVFAAALWIGRVLLDRSGWPVWSRAVSKEESGA